MQKDKKRKKQDREMFSVAKKYADVLPFLRNLPNKSAFICQAICEKIENDNIKKDNADTYLEDTIESLVKVEVENAIEKLLKEDYFLIKANLSTLEATQLSQIEKAEVVESNPENTEKDTTDEEYELIQSITNSW